MKPHITVWIVFDLEKRTPIGMARDFNGADAIAKRHLREGKDLGEERETLAMEVAIGSAS